MAIPESADFVKTEVEADEQGARQGDPEQRDAEEQEAEQQEAEQTSREKNQKEHEQLVVDLPDPADQEGTRKRAEEQVETALGAMPRWVQGAMEVPKGESAAETEVDVGGRAGNKVREDAQ